MNSDTPGNTPGDTPGSIPGNARRLAGKVARRAAAATRRASAEQRPAVAPSGPAGSPSGRSGPAEGARPGGGRPDRGQPAAPDPGDRRVARALLRVARGVHGADAVAATLEDLRDEAVLEQTTEDAVAAARRARALAGLGERLGRGVDHDEAVLATVRELIRVGERPSARALALAQTRIGRPWLESIGLSMVLLADNDLEEAWGFLSEVEPDRLAALVPVQAVAAAFRAGTPEAERVALDLGRRADQYDVPTLVALAGRFLVAGHADLARDLGAAATARVDAGEPVDDHDRAALENLQPWLHPAPVLDEAAAGDAVRIGILDYHQPDFDHASRNVGDYVQTLAVLGNLARFSDVAFDGEGGLGALLGELQGQVRDELRRPGRSGRAHLLPVSRDFSRGQLLPDQTWVLVFGWHAQPTFELGYGLPYHPSLQPIYFSFHVNHVNALTPEAIDHLREHGPIGCRDWTTVYLLLSAGVDAFFTGCVTTTIDTLFPTDRDRSGADVVGAIDLTPAQLRQLRGPVETVTHHGLEHRITDLTGGVRAARDLLDHYQSSYRRLVTSRLHAYLPATSLGVPVRFRPRNDSDVRFDGLTGFTPDSPGLNAMRDNLRDLLAGTLELVLTDAAGEGATHAERVARVREHWREVTAPLVAQARERLAAPLAVTPPAFPLDDIVARVAEHSHRYGPHPQADPHPGTARTEPGLTDVAMGLDQNLAEMLPVTVDSMLSHAGGPIRLWVTTRGLGEDYRSWFAERFPDLPVTFLSLDDVDYGDIARMLVHTTVATMDRLLLPEILAGLDRVTYLDIDTVVEGDVTELAALDLEGKALAARTTRGVGAKLWREAGDNLPPREAAELRRTMAARHRFDFVGFNAGVLVLDLARMRADGFSRDLVPTMVGCFGVHDQDVLNAYVGPDRVELPPRWNALPMLERPVDDGIVHYAGRGKPWDELWVPAGERWRRHQRRFLDRSVPPPGR